MARKIVVSVKGGEHINPAVIRDPGHVIDREKAAIGLFVTLTPPTKPMKTEAATVGFYESAVFQSQQSQKLQIPTIEGLLSGHERACYPDKAAKEKKTGKQAELF